MPHKNLELIQALRGIAALLVVLLHFQPIIRNDLPELAKALAHGEIGVDIFFVISGIVIYLSTHSSENRSAQSFIVRRFFRVVIPAWAAMLILACIKPPYLHQFISGLLFIPLENNHPPSYGYSFLIVAWTLTYELIFYSVFALVLSFSSGRRHRGLFASGLILAMVFTIQFVTGKFTIDANATIPISWGNPLPTQLFNLMGNPLFLEFLIGILLGWMYQERIIHRTHKMPVAASSLLATASAIIFSFQYQDGNGFTRSGIFASALVLSALVAQSLLETRKHDLPIRTLTPLAALGTISYSIYLIHPIARTALLTLFASFPQINPASSTMVFLALILGSFALSYAFYRLIEIPSQRVGKHIGRKFLRSSRTELAS